MALEVEKKFLVFAGRLPELPEGQRLVQGYLSEEPSIRYRLSGDQLRITVKEIRADGSRMEIETANPAPSEEELAALARVAIVPPIEKIRYRIPYAGLIWELDVYQKENGGLLTVDVELPCRDYPISFPDWVNSEREITSEICYFNINLARNPYAAWGPNPLAK